MIAGQGSRAGPGDRRRRAPVRRSRRRARPPATGGCGLIGTQSAHVQAQSLNISSLGRARAGRLGAARDPGRWDEIVALGLGELRGEPPADGVVRRVKADSRLVAPGRSLRRAQHRCRLRRRRRGARCRHARPGRPGGGARRARVARPLAVGRARRRRRRLDGQDVDEGHPRRALRGGDADGLGRGEPEQRDRPAADRAAARAGHGRARHRDGHARARADRRALRDRASDRRARHVDRPRAPRARRHRRGRRASERRGDRRRCRRAASRSFLPTRPSSSRTSAAPTSRSGASTGDGDAAETTSAGAFPSPAASSRSSCRSAPPHGREHPRRAHRLRRARAPARSGAGGCATHRAVPLARRGAAAARRRLRRQRRLQREPDLDARGAARPRRAREGRRRVAILGEMAELGDAADRYHDEIGDLLGDARDRARRRRRRAGARRISSRRRRMHWIADAAAFDEVADASPPGRRDPRQGVARRRPRRHPRRDRETG